MNSRPRMAVIPSHLLVSCIQKMEPQAFARTYCTCFQVKSQIERNKRSICISLPHTVSIEAIPEGIAVRVVKDKAVLRTEICTPDEFLQNGICRLAFFRFASISFNVDSFFRDKWFCRLLAAFQKYRITFSHCSTPYSPHISLIAKSLRVKYLQVRGPICNSTSELFLGDVPSIEKLTVARTDGHAADNLLRNIAPRCQHVDLKFLGNVQVYSKLIAICIKQVQNGGEKRSGKISVVQTTGDDVSASRMAEMFDGSALKIVDLDDNGHSFIALPFEDGDRLLLVWKKYYSPLKRLRGINFWYSTATEADDLRKLFLEIYTRREQKTVLGKTMEMVQKRNL